MHCSCPCFSHLYRYVNIISLDVVAYSFEYLLTILLSSNDTVYLQSLFAYTRKIATSNHIEV
jgi:hypothetical protein